MPETTIPYGGSENLLYETGIVSKDAPLSNKGYPTAPLKKGDPSYGKLGEWQVYSITLQIVIVRKNSSITSPITLLALPFILPTLR